MSISPNHTIEKFQREVIAILSYLGYIACKIYPYNDSNLEKFVHSYGCDLTMPAGFFLMARAYNVSPKAALTIIGSAGIISEFANKISPNCTYDPNDFLAYAASLGTAYLIDRKIERK